MMVLCLTVLAVLFVVYCIELISCRVGVELYSYVYNNLEFVWFLDKVSVVRVCMLLVCSVFALVYCYHYFGFSDEGSSLFFMVVLFVSVMLGLMMSGSLVLSLIFWEYLGFVRFLLILFYSKMSRLRASLVTLASSRFGDVALFLVLGVMIRYRVDIALVGVALVTRFILVLLTKSASFPFIA